MKERKPKTVVMLIELEDNCGAVLAKAKVEVPVDRDIDADLTDAYVAGKFREFVAKLPTKVKI
jgi:hypothetical protein